VPIINAQNLTASPKRRKATLSFWMDKRTLSRYDPNRMKPNAIFTASDAKYGDFLIDHWFASLRDNVDLTQLEVVILDYGLTTAQRFYLEQHGVRVVPCQRDGHVVIIRFRDMAAYLRQHAFEQVILSDSGDIIFQSDFTPQLRENPTQFRGVPEDLRAAFGVFLTEEFFSKEDRKRLKKNLKHASMVNAGFIMGPGRKMRELAEEVDRVVIFKEKFGPDQLVVNDVFLREGYVPLARDYNYVIATAKAKMEIRKGQFFTDGRLICVVHNTGNVKMLRPVENFGYGPDRNQLKKELYIALQALHSTTDSVFESRSELSAALTGLKTDLARGYQNSLEQVDYSWQLLKSYFSKEEDREDDTEED
jgi:hypothetical protein